MPPFNQFGPHRPPTSGQPAKMLEFDGMGGGQAKSMSARGAGAVRECSTGRRERYIRTMTKDATRAGRARNRRRKNTLVMRGSPGAGAARCPGF